MTITIPPEAVEAAARAAHDQWRHECAVTDEEPIENWREWADLELAEQLGWIEQATAALRAGLEAWPGVYGNGLRKKWKHYTPAVILPLMEPEQ